MHCLKKNINIWYYVPTTERFLLKYRNITRLVQKKVLKPQIFRFHTYLIFDQNIDYLLEPFLLVLNTAAAIIDKTTESVNTHDNSSGVTDTPNWQRTSSDGDPTVRFPHVARFSSKSEYFTRLFAGRWTDHTQRIIKWFTSMLTDAAENVCW